MWPTERSRMIVAMTTAAWIERTRTTFATKRGEAIVHACRAGRAQSIVAVHPGPLGDLVSNMVERRRAAGLPERFALVLTKSELRAHGMDERTGEVDPHTQLAAWPRTSLAVRTTARGPFTEIVLAAGDDRVAIRALADEHTARLLQALG
jgi:hypothetical protein